MEINAMDGAVNPVLQHYHLRSDTMSGVNPREREDL